MKIILTFIALTLFSYGMSQSKDSSDNRLRKFNVDINKHLEIINHIKLKDFNPQSIIIKVSVDLSNNPAGVYLVRVSQGGPTFYFKLVKK